MVRPGTAHPSSGRPSTAVPRKAPDGTKPTSAGGASAPFSASRRTAGHKLSSPQALRRSVSAAGLRDGRRSSSAAKRSSTAGRPVTAMAGERANSRPKSRPVSAVPHPAWQRRMSAESTRSWGSGGNGTVQLAPVMERHAAKDKDETAGSISGWRNEPYPKRPGCPESSYVREIVIPPGQSGFPGLKHDTHLGPYEGRARPIWMGPH